MIESEREKLKKLIHQKDLSRLDKVLLILFIKGEPISVKEIRKIAEEVGLREAKSWNISEILRRSKGKAINVGGWEITDAGKEYIHNFGIVYKEPSVMKIIGDLRAHLKKLKDIETRSFVEEAIRCHEEKLYRSAIVMSWLGAIDVLHKYVHANYLAEFNSEAKRVVGKKWKEARTPEDIGKMKDIDFLDRIESISIIGKSVKIQLRHALDLRNACGHPNSLKISANQSAAHLELLMQNVFEKFC